MNVTFPNVSFPRTTFSGQKATLNKTRVVSPVADTNADADINADVKEAIKGKKYGFPLCVPFYVMNPSIHQRFVVEKNPEEDILKKYIDNYVNEKVIANAINKNPEITRILKLYKIKPIISQTNINQSAKDHMFATYKYAKEIVEELEANNKFKVPENRIKLNDKEKTTLYQAALLHDIGKALIPEKIVQKPGRLTLRERDIMGIHARLGYEILKTTNVSEDVMHVIRTHHLPVIEKENDIVSQILSVADVYSALTEKRPYRDAMNNDKAFGIMTDPRLCQDYVGVLKHLKCG